MLFSHGTEGVGLATIARWQQAVEKARCRTRLVGVDASRYPRDFAVFSRYAKHLARLGPRYARPEPMSCAYFEQALAMEGSSEGVRERRTFARPLSADKRFVWPSFCTTDGVRLTCRYCPPLPGGAIGVLLLHWQWRRFAAAFRYRRTLGR